MATLDNSRANLDSAWRTLNGRWEELRTVWDDPVSHAFERDTWQALQTDVAAADRALQQLAQVVAQAQRAIK